MKYTWVAIFKRFYVFIFRDRKGTGKRGRETSMWERDISISCLSYALTLDQTRNSDMCPDGENELATFRFAE